MFERRGEVDEMQRCSYVCIAISILEHAYPGRLDPLALTRSSPVEWSITTTFETMNRVINKDDAPSIVLVPILKHSQQRTPEERAALGLIMPDLGALTRRRAAQDPEFPTQSHHRDITLPPARPPPTQSFTIPVLHPSSSLAHSLPASPSLYCIHSPTTSSPHTSSTIISCPSIAIATDSSLLPDDYHHLVCACPAGVCVTLSRQHRAVLQQLPELCNFSLSPCRPSLPQCYLTQYLFMPGA